MISQQKINNQNSDQTNIFYIHDNKIYFGFWPADETKQYI